MSRLESGTHRMEFCEESNEILILEKSETEAGGILIKEVYAIDLDRVNSVDDLTDWIFQLAGKQWVTDEFLGQIVRGLDALLKPQQFMLHNRMDPNKWWWVRPEMEAPVE